MNIHVIKLKSNNKNYAVRIEDAFDLEQAKILAEIKFLEKHADYPVEVIM